MHSKQVRNGLIVIGAAVALWRIARIVSLSAYSKVGPFVNSSAPGIDQNFLNGIENYLNCGVANSGVPLISKIASVSVPGQTGVAVNHNLRNASGTSITPDIVLLVFPNKQGLHAASYDTLTSTQVTLYADVTINVAGIALKF